jgi:hypothetical protein
MAFAHKGLAGSDSLPRAHVVRDGSQPIPKLRLQSSVRDSYRRAEPGVNTALHYLVGMWPLVLIVIISAALLWSAGNTDPALGR